MISGSPKILSKSGPVDILTITNINQKYKKRWKRFWKNILFNAGSVDKADITYNKHFDSIHFLPAKSHFAE